jgi:hypothetical protein
VADTGFPAALQIISVLLQISTQQINTYLSPFPKLLDSQACFRTSSIVNRSIAERAIASVMKIPHGALDAANGSIGKRIRLPW